MTGSDSQRSGCESQLVGEDRIVGIRRIISEPCPSLRRTSEAAIERSVTSPSCHPSHAIKCRREPLRIVRKSSALLSATCATAFTIWNILGRGLSSGQNRPAGLELRPMKRLR